MNAKPRSASPPNRNSASTDRKRRAGGDDRARQRLVDAEVDDLFERLAPHRAQVLAHAVEDHDRVVHRIAGNRQQRGDDVQRQVVAEERQKRERDEDVVERRGDRADGEREPEADADVDGDRQNRRQRRVDAATLQIGADDRADQVAVGRSWSSARRMQRLLDLRPATPSEARSLSRPPAAADQDLPLRRIVVPAAPPSSPGMDVSALRTCVFGDALLDDERACRRRNRCRAAAARSP